MEPWCTAAEVDERVAGSPQQELLADYAVLATETLYILTGRAYSGEGSVIAQYKIDRRGYVKLGDWQPVRGLTAATIDSLPVVASLSPAGTFAVLPIHKAGMIVALSLEVGQNPPVAGRRAAAALAAELLRSDPRYATVDGASDVILSSRLISVARQGVTFTYADPAVLAEKDLTGIREVDLFVKSVNPTGSRYQPKVVTA